MIPEIRTIQPLADSRWDSLVNTHPLSSIYHHSDWLKVISSTYRHVSPVAFVIENGPEIKAALPACIVKSRLTGIRMVSLPFTSYCNPLSEKPEEDKLLVEAAIGSLKGHGAKYYELRTLSPILNCNDLKRHGYHMTHILNLAEGFDRVKKGISSNIVSNKKKAERAGILVRRGDTEKDLRAFYTIHAITRKKQGFPIQPYSFFKNMFEMMGPRDHVRFLLAELNGKVIAGIVLFLFKKTISYEIGASLPEYLESRPNHLLLWNAVETACEEGRHFFDFGKSPPDNPGLVEFKRRWGAVAHDCPYYYYPVIAGMMSMEQNSMTHRAMRSLYRQSPLVVAQFLGRGIYRHMG